MLSKKYKLAAEETKRCIKKNNNNKLTNEKQKGPNTEPCDTPY